MDAKEFDKLAARLESVPMPEWYRRQGRFSDVIETTIDSLVFYLCPGGDNGEFELKVHAAYNGQRIDRYMGQSAVLENTYKSALGFLEEMQPSIEVAAKNSLRKILDK